MGIAGIVLLLVMGMALMEAAPGISYGDEV
jgi:hypothetical protein